MSRRHRGFAQPFRLLKSVVAHGTMAWLSDGLKKRCLKGLKTRDSWGSIHLSIHPYIHPSIYLYIYIYKHQILPDYKGLKLKLKVASSNSSNIWCLHPFFCWYFPPWSAESHRKSSQLYRLLWIWVPMGAPKRPLHWDPVRLSPEGDPTVDPKVSPKFWHLWVPMFIVLRAIFADHKALSIALQCRLFVLHASGEFLARRWRTSGLSWEFHYTLSSLPSGNLT